MLSTVRIDRSCSSVVERSRLLRGDSGARDPGRADNDARPSVLNTGRATRFWFSSSCWLFLFSWLLPSGSASTIKQKTSPLRSLRFPPAADPPSFGLIAPPLPAGTKPSKQPTGGLHHAWPCCFFRTDGLASLSARPGSRALLSPRRRRLPSTTLEHERSMRTVESIEAPSPCLVRPRRCHVRSRRTSGSIIDLVRDFGHLSPADDRLAR